MTAIWTPPITWSATLTTVTQFREQIRDNQEYLFDPANDSIDYDEGTDKTTTTTGFQAVDTGGGTDLRLSVDSYGEDIAVSFTGFASLVNSGANAGGLYFNVLIDGTTSAVADDGIQAAYAASLASAIYFPVRFRVIITGLAAGTHTFDLTWKVSASGGTTTGTLYAGAGTTRLDTRPQMDARKAA